MQYTSGTVSKHTGLIESIDAAKFIRRTDLTPFIRLYIAFTTVMAKKNGLWGMVTALSREYTVSRTFIYALAITLEHTSEVIFGPPALNASQNEKKLVYSHMLSLRLEGRCSLDSSSTIMKRFGQSTSATSSISRYLKYFGSVVPDTIRSSDNEIQMTVFASDEVFSRQKPILITVDPISSAILRMELSDTRKAEDWQNHWECIENNGYEAEYVVCDEGQGLCRAHQKVLPDVIRQIDTYHAIAHKLGQWVNRLEDAAYSAIDAEDKCYKKLDSARSDNIIEKRIREFEYAEKNAVEAIDLYETYSFLYQCLISELMIFDSAGKLRDREASEESMNIALELVESLNNEKLKKYCRQTL